MIVTYHNERGQKREFPSFKSTVEKPTRTCQREKSCDIIQKLSQKPGSKKSEASGERKESCGIDPNRC